MKEKGWYLIRGIIIAVLIIIIIAIQVQNAERQKELQNQQEILEWEANQKECISKCISEWEGEYGTCEERFEVLKNIGASSSLDPEDFTCERSYPSEEGGCHCECSCDLTYTFELN